MATGRAFLAGLAAVTMPKLGWADVGSPNYLAAGRVEMLMCCMGCQPKVKARSKFPCLPEAMPQPLIQACPKRWLLRAGQAPSRW